MNERTDNFRFWAERLLDASNKAAAEVKNPADPEEFNRLQVEAFKLFLVDYRELARQEAIR